MQQVGALGLTNDPKIHTFVTCHVLPGLPGAAAAAAAEGDGGSLKDPNVFVGIRFSLARMFAYVAYIGALNYYYVM